MAEIEIHKEVTVTMTLTLNEIGTLNHIVHQYMSELTEKLPNGTPTNVKLLSNDIYQAYSEAVR